MRLKSLFLFSVVFITGCFGPTIPTGTVKITNLEGNSGGTGTIVSSSTSFSEVLTNAHVCGVVKNGGLIHTLRGTQHFVVSYKTSELHDLCLIKVWANLWDKTEVASAAPLMFEAATVSGHPRLMPNIITKGHFSGKQIIQVVTGFKECTDSDRNDPMLGIFCLFLGRLPIIRAYEAIAVSATIQPGSSGSAVYGEDNKISGVIFAGSGELSYGYAVPYEYVANFLNVEYALLKTQVPATSHGIKAETESKRELIKKLTTLCQTVDNRVCKLFKEANQNNDLIQY
jgi:hypothetical protein